MRPARWQPYIVPIPSWLDVGTRAVVYDIMETLTEQHADLLAVFDAADGFVVN